MQLVAPERTVVAFRVLRVLVCVMACSGCDYVFKFGDPHTTEPVDALTERANYVFVTSSEHTGALGGLAGADAICQQRATEASLPGMYVAYLSTSTNSARSRLDSARGWQRTDGLPVIDLPSQLTSYLAWYPVSLDEAGNDVRPISEQVWTGSKVNSQVDGVATCMDWTVTTPLRGAVGRAGSGAKRLANDDRTLTSTRACQEMHRLFCFELGLRTAALPAAPAGKLVFLSSQTWKPNAGGVASADAVCQTEAAQASRMTTFKAALAPAGISVESRFAASSEPRVRADGAIVAPDTANFFAATFTVSHVMMDAAGVPVADDLTWAGDPTSTTGACANWTSTTGPADAGFNDSTTRALRFRGTGQDCGLAGARLLCLED